MRRSDPVPRTCPRYHTRGLDNLICPRGAYSFWTNTTIRAVAGYDRPASEPPEPAWSPNLLVRDRAAARKMQVVRKNDRDGIDMP